MSRLGPSRIVALVVALFLVAAACGADEERTIISSGVDPSVAPRDIVDTLVSQEFAQFTAALEASPTGETLRGEGPFTVFAPTDDAFASLPTGLLPLLLEPANRGLLTDIVNHHVVEGQHMGVELLEGGQFTSLEGSTIAVEATETPSDDPDGEPTSSVTIGATAPINVTGFDQLATNGVIHTVDAVLIPEDRLDDVSALADQIVAATDIVSTLEAAGDFTEFLAGLEAEELTSTLSGEGAFTVFAPTDEAFAGLTDQQRELLGDVLRFHIFETEAPTDAILTRRAFRTMEGQRGLFARILTHPEIDEDDEDADLPPPTIHFEYEGIELSEVDIEATNGVIHVLDELAIPDSVRGPGGF